MTVRVKGYLDGTVYDVQMEPGAVHGSPRVAALVTQWTGRQVRPGPNHQSLTVDIGDPRSVVALLATAGRVVAVQDPDGVTTLPARRYGTVD